MCVSHREDTHNRHSVSFLSKKTKNNKNKYQLYFYFHTMLPIMSRKPQTNSNVMMFSSLQRLYCTVERRYHDNVHLMDARKDLFISDLYFSFHCVFYRNRGRGGESGGEVRVGRGVGDVS